MLIISPTHPFVSPYWLFLDLWNSTGLQMSWLFGVDPERRAQFLRSIQLLTSVYCQSITTLILEQARILPVSEFTQLFNDLRIQSWTTPQLPAVPIGYQTLYTTPCPAPSQPPAPEPALGPSQPCEEYKSHLGYSNYNKEYKLSVEFLTHRWSYTPMQLQGGGGVPLPSLPLLIIRQLY